MSRASGLSPADKNRLGWACKPIRDAFDTYPYLVGSALDSSDYRDIDIRLILDDDDFRRMFGGRGDGMARLRLVNTALSALVQQASGLPKPIDFQIQPQSYANDEHSKPRNPLGMSSNRGGYDAPDWSVSPTPTGPERCSIAEVVADLDRSWAQTVANADAAFSSRPTPTGPERNPCTCNRVAEGAAFHLPTCPSCVGTGLATPTEPTEETP